MFLGEIFEIQTQTRLEMGPDPTRLQPGCFPFDLKGKKLKNLMFLGGNFQNSNPNHKCLTRPDPSHKKLTQPEPITSPGG